MKLYDISLPIFPGMVVWPDNPNVTLRRTLDQAKGDIATVSELSLGVHTGTHLDAPLHFVPGGAGVEALSLDVLCGPALVCHARHPQRPRARFARHPAEIRGRSGTRLPAILRGRRRQSGSGGQGRGPLFPAGGKGRRSVGGSP